MASRTRTTPAAVVKVVSITSVPGTYRRSTVYSPAGRMDQCPPSGSRMRAKIASESYRGKQSQSIDPSRLTRAAELQSASNPCSPIGVEAPRAAAGAAAGWVAAELMALQSGERGGRYVCDTTFPAAREAPPRIARWTGTRPGVRGDEAASRRPRRAL